MKEQKVSRKRKTVHRSGVTPKPTPTPTHACKGCGAPFPLLDALAQQYGMDWSKANLTCSACQKPVNINVTVKIDTKPFEDVMKTIAGQLAEFQEIVSEIEVGDVRVTEAPKPKIVPEKEEAHWLKTPQVVSAHIDDYKHVNVRVVAEPMEFAKVKESRLKKFFRNFRGGHDGNSSKRPAGKGTTQDNLSTAGNPSSIKTSW